jgi:hypothetical protein
MGKLEYLHHVRKQPKNSLDTARQIIVYYQNFIPAMIEQIYLNIDLDNWDLALEACGRLQSVYADHIDQLLALLVHELLIKGNLSNSEEYMGTLLKALDRDEPLNHEFYFSVSRIVSRLSTKNAK